MGFSQSTIHVFGTDDVPVNVFFRKRLFTETVSANKYLFTGTVSANKKLFTETGIPIETSPRVLGSCDEFGVTLSLLELIAKKNHTKLTTSVFKYMLFRQ